MSRREWQYLVILFVGFVITVSLIITVLPASTPAVTIPTLMVLPTEPPAVAELPDTSGPDPVAVANEPLSPLPAAVEVAQAEPIQVASAPTDPPPDPATELPTHTATSSPTTPPTLPPPPTNPPPTNTTQYGSFEWVATPVSVPVYVPPVDPVPGQIVVQFAPEASAEERAAYVEAIGGTVTEAITALAAVVVTVTDTTAAAELPSSPIVAEAEPDYFISAAFAIPPNDPLYGDQWALQAINAPQAWAAMPADAPHVPIAVIDSGICAAHPDMAGRILPGYDFVQDDTDPQDDFGHGCAVSGIIAANADDGIGIAGAAPNAMIMPLRVLDASGMGMYSDVAAAITFAADNGAQVINLSLGGAARSSVLEAAIDYAIARGVIVVAAAGNTGDAILFPAAYEPVISVGAVDQNLQLASFSAHGADVLAPGVAIHTTDRAGTWAAKNGTSFAAPYVAGVASTYGNISIEINGNLLRFSASGIELPTPPHDELTPTQPMPPTSAPFNYASLLETVHEATVAYANLTPDADIRVSDIQYFSEWAFGISVIAATEISGEPTLLLFLARFDPESGTWQIALETNETFSAWLELAPTGFFSQEALTVLQSNVTDLGDGSANLSLPWPFGESRVFTGGPHQGSASDQTLRAALDFAGNAGTVSAANSGVVWRASSCPNFIRVDHAGGWQTGYYHVINERVSNGQSVSRGQVIADQSAQYGCGGYATGPHVHFSTRRNGAPVSIHNMDIGGWNVQQGATEYAGCMTNLRTGTQSCVGGSLYNDGAIGTGNANIRNNGTIPINVDSGWQNITAGQQHVWSYTYSSGMGNYLIDIQAQGTVRYDMILRGPDGNIVTQSVSGVDGRGILAFEGTIRQGDYTLTLIPHAGTSGQYGLRVWPNAIPRLFFSYDSSGYSNTLHWQWWLDQTTTYHVLLNRTSDNFEYTWRIVNRQNGQQIANGTSISGNMLSTLTTGSGWYDLYLQPINNTFGSYFIDIRQGTSAPERPTITSPASGSTVSSPFTVQLQRGNFNHTGRADYHIQIDNNTDFSSPEYDSISTQGAWSQSTTFSVTLSSLGTYHIRARQGDTVSSASDWSNSVTITHAGAPSVRIVNGRGPTRMDAGQQIQFSFSVQNNSPAGTNVTGRVNYTVGSTLPYTNQSAPNGTYAPTGFAFPNFTQSNRPSVDNWQINGATSSNFTARGTVNIYNWNARMVEVCNELFPPDQSALGIIAESLLGDFLNWLQGEQISDLATLTRFQFLEELSDVLDIAEGALNFTQRIIQGSQAYSSATFSFTPRINYTFNSVPVTVSGTPIYTTVNVPAGNITQYIGGVTAVAAGELWQTGVDFIPGRARLFFAFTKLYPAMLGCLAITESSIIDTSSVIASEAAWPRTYSAPPSIQSWNAAQDPQPFYDYAESLFISIGNASYYIGQRNDMLVSGSEVGDLTALNAVGASMVAAINQAVTDIDGLMSFINADTSGFDYTEFQRSMYETRESLLQFSSLETSALDNGGFDFGAAGWTVTPNLQLSTDYGIASLTQANVAGSGVLSQTQSLNTPVGHPFEVNLQLSNSTGSPRPVTVVVRSATSSVGALQCIFSVPANSPMATYQLWGRSNIAWSNVTFELIVNNPDGVAGIQVDNIELQSPSSRSFNGLTCTHPPPPPLVTNTNLIVNGDFTGGYTGWLGYHWNPIAINGGAMEFSLPQGQPYGVLWQQINRGLANGTPLELSFDLQNTSSTPRTLQVYLRDQDWGTARQCNFTLPANMPMRRFTMQALTGSNWGTILAQWWWMNGDGGPVVRIDNIDLRQPSPATFTGTTCSGLQASANENLIANGDFGQGYANWLGYHWNPVSITNGAFTFGLPNGQPWGVLWQEGSTGVPNGAPLELSFQLANTASASRSFTVYLRSTDWNTLQQCSFTVPANLPMTTYRMRIRTGAAFDRVFTQFWLLNGDGQPPMQIDDVVLRYRPELSVTALECNGATTSPTVGNLIQNPSFNGGFASWWGIGLNPVYVQNAMMSFDIPAGQAYGTMWQEVAVPVTAGTPLELSFNLGNTGSIAQTVRVFLRDLDWGTARSCSFTLPANAAMRTYSMRAAPGTNWGRILAQWWLDNGDGSPAITIDDVSLYTRPGTSTALECSAPLALEVDPLLVDATGPSVPTLIPTATPSLISNAIPTATASATTTAIPTATTSVTMTVPVVPTLIPTATATSLPPTEVPPTAIPTAISTDIPTEIPTVIPTATATEVPPTAIPTEVPTEVPPPTEVPTVPPPPTDVPTAVPTEVPPPTAVPTEAPLPPTDVPTEVPPVEPPPVDPGVVPPAEGGA